MQNRAKAELKKAVVESVHVDIDPDYDRTDNCTLKVTGKAELRTPKEENDPTFLLVLTMNIVSKEQPNAVNIKSVTTFCFELDQLVDDYDSVVRDQCLSVIQDWQKKMANKLIADMGYPEIFLEVEDEA